MRRFDFLDVPLRESVIERAQILEPKGDVSHFEVYAVFPLHPAYQYLSFVQMSVEAMTRTICAIKEVEYPKDGHLGLSAPGFGLSCRVQMDDAVDLALQNSSPPYIHLPIDHRGKKGAHGSWASAFRPWLTYILQIGFIHLYETNQKTIRKHGGEAGDLAALVRDSAAHGGLVMTKRDVTFRNFRFLRSQNKKEPLSDFFDFGDYLALAICMFDAQKLSISTP